MWPTTLGLTADRFPHGGATMFALLAAFGNAGGTMNMVIGSVADWTNLHVALAMMAVCPMIMLAPADVAESAWFGFGSGTSS